MHSQFLLSATTGWGWVGTFCTQVSSSENTREPRLVHTPSDMWPPHRCTFYHPTALPQHSQCCLSANARGTPLILSSFAFTPLPKWQSKMQISASPFYTCQTFYFHKIKFSIKKAPPPSSPYPVVFHPSESTTIPRTSSLKSFLSWEPLRLKPSPYFSLELIVREG